MSLSWSVDDVDQVGLDILVSRIALSLKAGDVIALSGPLGVGKTTFARSLITRLGGEDEVPSPTFALMQRYETKRLTLTHCDLYRLEPSELDELGLEDARREARAVLGQVASGHDPLLERRRAAETGRNTLRAVCERYLVREGGKLRTTAKRQANLERLVYPAFGARPIDSIRRSELVRLLDKIEDQNGPVMSDRCLGYLTRIFNWHASRSDEFPGFTFLLVVELFRDRFDQLGQGDRLGPPHPVLAPRGVHRIEHLVALGTCHCVQVFFPLIAAVLEILRSFPRNNQRFCIYA